MRTRLAAVAACAIVAALLVGCSDDSGAGEGAAAAAPRSFFGVVPQSTLTADDLDRMQQGGVGTIRLVVPWGELDKTPAPDDTDFSSIDPVILSAARNGIRVLPTLYGTPAWVAEQLDGESNCDPRCATFAPRSREALAAWGDFVGAIVDRYGPDGSLWTENPDVQGPAVRDWQIWNEQNSPTFFRPDPDPAAYEKVLSTAAGAIQERDPGAHVILGGMFGTPFDGHPPAYTAWRFLRRLYAIPGARDEFDGVAAHPYAAHLDKIQSQVQLMHDEMARANDPDATIWITEVGASSATGPNPLERGPDGQADELREAFGYFLDMRLEWNIAAVTWYSWRDTSGPALCDWCEQSGLFEAATLTPKPAWDAFLSFSGGS